MALSLSDQDWQVLLKRINDGKCTPFLGAGASAEYIPLARSIAEMWAQEYGYPLADTHDLARVAEFRALQADDIQPKEEVAALCKPTKPPDFAAPNQIHGLLAELPLPVYVTTNYDDLMSLALRQSGREPRAELCRWNRFIAGTRRDLFGRGSNYRAAVGSPVVYHLHGHMDVPQSIVLTENDYIDFLVKISSERNFLPAPIINALAGTTLLFLGYSRSDWNFRVLFRGLVNAIAADRGMFSVAVQTNPTPADAPDASQERARQYLDRYFEKILRNPVRVYWGTVSDFAAELRQRRKAFNGD